MAVVKGILASGSSSRFSVAAVFAEMGQSPGRPREAGPTGRIWFQPSCWLRSTLWICGDLAPRAQGWAEILRLALWQAGLGRELPVTSRVRGPARPWIFRITASTCRGTIRRPHQSAGLTPGAANTP